jgi:predicted DNA-binding transcriptional regulator AlpA
MQITRTIRRTEVLSKTGLSRTSVHNLEKKGEFPLHWMQTPRVAVWDEGEVETWLQKRRAAPAQPTQAPDQAMRKRKPGRNSKEGVAQKAAEKAKKAAAKASANLKAPTVATCWVKPITSRSAA